MGGKEKWWSLYQTRLWMFLPLKKWMTPTRRNREKNVGPVIPQIGRGYNGPKNVTLWNSRQLACVQSCKTAVTFSNFLLFSLFKKIWWSYSFSCLSGLNLKVAIVVLSLWSSRLWSLKQCFHSSCLFSYCHHVSWFLIQIISQWFSVFCKNLQSLLVFLFQLPNPLKGTKLLQ